MTSPYPQGPGPGYQDGFGPGGAVATSSYLHGAPVSFGQAVREGLRHVLTFQGRASRSAFWWFALFTLIAQLILDAVVGFGSHNSRADSVIHILTALLTLALSVRRLHDANHSGWWWLIGFIPIVGWIVLFFFYLRRGTPGPNRFDVNVAGTAIR